jgi:hypothetical protein
MSKKNRSIEILEDIKKNDPRFSDMVIGDSDNSDWPSYAEFIKMIDITEEDFKKAHSLEYVNESHNNS